MSLNSRNNKKMELLNVTIDELVKYKKSVYIRNISLVFLIIYLFINILIDNVSFGVDFSHLKVLTLLFMIISYVIFLKFILKMLNKDSMVSNSLYTPGCLNKIIRKNNTKETNISLEKNYRIEKVSDDEILSVKKLVNNIELNLYLKYLMPIIFISTTSMFLLISSEEINGVRGLFENIISVKVIVYFGLSLFLCLYIILELTNSSFKFQSKIKSKTINKLEIYYKSGCIDYIDYKIIEEEYGYMSLYNENLISENYLNILEKYNITKQKLVETYIIMSTKESIKTLSLWVTITYVLLSVLLLNIPNKVSVITGIFLMKYIESKTSSVIKDKLIKVNSDEEYMKTIFNKICSKSEYFQYCIITTLIGANKKR